MKIAKQQLKQIIVEELRKLRESNDDGAFVVVPGEVDVPGTGITIQFRHGANIRSGVPLKALQLVPEYIMQKYGVHKAEEE